MKTKFISIVVLVFSFHFANGQCYCEDCPEDIIANTNTLATLNVSNATNATLGQNGQSLVNVGVLFTHEAAQELSLRIVAPDGSFVDLAIGQGLSFGNNNYFNIDFVQCSNIAIPDCDNDAIWNSFDEWEQGPYTGSYYPESGCLEDLTGSVNGEWRLEIFDTFFVEDGEVLCFDITFADDSGITCMNSDCGALFCQAQGGNQQIPFEVDAPEGDPSLDFDITIDYLNCEFPAPAPEYIITYLIYDAVTFLIIEFQDEVDLTQYDEGVYVVQAYSILASDLPVLLALDPSTETVFTIYNLIQNQTICADNTEGATVVTIGACIIDFFGTLNPASIGAFEGDITFNTSWFYTWSPAAPDPAIWTEVWVVYDSATSTLVGYFDDPDFTSLPPGSYSVYVLSYQIVDQPLLPPIDGVSSINDISNDINNGVLCGQLFGINTLDVWELCQLSIDGTLESETITAPQGDSALDPDWDITYTGSPPDPTEYQFYFLVLDLATDEIIAYYTTDDFTALPPGEYYTVALWVDLDDLGLLPPADGANTIADLDFLISSQQICAQYFGNNELYITAPCLANAGDYPTTPPEGCEGSIDLDLGWEINTTYQPGTEPDPTLYTLEFIISQNNVIIDILPDTDLTGFAIGVYEICGFSFLTSDAPLIPVPNGILSVDDLNTAIQNEDFCGDIHDNCATIEILPITFPDFTGPTQVCAGELVQYVVNDFSGNNLDYLYTINQGGFQQFTNDENGTLDVIWLTGPGNICTENIAEPCGEQICIQIDVIPQPIFNIIGPTEVCPGEEVVYTFDPPIVNPQFSLSTVAGGSIVNEGSGIITILWDATNTGTITSEVFGGACPSEEIIFNVTKIEDIIFPTLSIPTESCDGSGLAIADLNPGDFVDWTWSATNADIIIANGFVNFTWQNVGPAQICLEVESECDTESQCFDLDILATPMPTIAPNLEFCSLTFTLDATPDFGNSWFWTAPGSGGSVSYSDQTSFTTDVTVTSPGTYTFILQEFSNPCGGSVETTVVVLDGLETTAPQYVCDNQGDYIVSFSILTGTAPYSVEGVQITGSIYTSGSISSGTSSNFTVTDSEGCSAEVFGFFDCPCTTDAGTMVSDLLTACIADNNTVTVTSVGDATPDFNDIGVYILHTLPVSGLGTVIAISNTGEFGFDSNSMIAGQTYYVSYVVGNEENGTVDLLDPCLSVAIGQPIVFYDDPLVDAGNDADICGFEFNLSANAPTVGGVWSIVDFPTGALTDLQLISGETLVSVDMAGEYTFELEFEENGCTGSDEIILTFIDNPSPISVSTFCNADNYTVEFIIQGGDAPYQVNGNLITVDQFISQSFASGDIYSFIITDANGCDSELITGTKLCDCETSAGTVPTEVISICAVDGTQISSTNNADAVFDSDDAGVYIIHTGSSNILGTVVAESATGDFIYDTSFGTDVTLYISYVVGDSIGNSLDFTDPCLSVSLGQPLEISPLLKTDAGSYTSGCNYTIDLNADDQGASGMWSVIASPTGSNITFDNESDATSNMEVDMAGEYMLAWIPSGNDCVIPDTTTILFDTLFELTTLTEICSDDLTSFEVEVSFTGGVSPYFVSGVEVNSSFTSQSFSSGDLYNIVIMDSKGCEITIAGIYECQCDNQAGTMNLSLLFGCVSDTISVTYNNDAVLTGTDEEYFVVHDSSTDNLGNIIGIYGTNEITYNTNFVIDQTYYVSHVIGGTVNNTLDLNSPCLKVSVGQPITFRDATIISAGEDRVVCGLISEMNGNVPFEYNAFWSVISSPFGAIVSLPVSTLNAVIEVDRPGTYLIELLSDSGSCPSRDTVSYEFIESFISADFSVNCMVDGYTVSFMLEGGTEPYYIDGTPIVGSSFESTQIPFGTDYSFDVSDESTCDDIAISGVDICECESDAGTMAATPLSLCEDETITASELTLGDYTFDDNDVAVFVVHTLPDETLGDILHIVSFNSFDLISFDNLIFDYNTTYYLSLVVGNPNGNEVDYSDLCTSVASGTPFSWIQKTSVSIEGGGEGCAGNLIPLVVTTTGELPIEIVLSSSTNQLSTYQISQSPQTISIEVNQSETYNLFDILGTDCEELSSDNVNIILLENEMLEILTEDKICLEDVTEELFNLNTYIIEGDEAGLWYIDQQVVPVMIDLSSFGIGEYLLEYRVDGVCSPLNGFVSLELEECSEPCPEFTSEHEDVSCFGLDDGVIRIYTDNLEISSESGISLNGELLPTYPILNLAPGIYEVNILDQNNCSDDFTIEITEPDAVLVSLGEDMNAKINDPITIEAITNLLDQNIEGVTWASLRGIFEETNLELTTTFENDDEISITIIDENGCSGIDDIMVRVELAEVFIPNVISPNSNSGNSTFQITSNASNSIINQLQIYDRWGNKVFGISNISPSNESASWNGQYNNSDVIFGVYVYYLEMQVGDEVIQKLGDITVLR